MQLIYNYYNFVMSIRLFYFIRRVVSCCLLSEREIHRFCFLLRKANFRHHEKACAFLSDFVLPHSIEPWSVGVTACLRVCMRACTCVRACVGASVHACVRLRERVRAWCVQASARARADVGRWSVTRGGDPRPPRRVTVSRPPSRPAGHRLATLSAALHPAPLPYTGAIK